MTEATRLGNGMRFLIPILLVLLVGGMATFAEEEAPDLDSLHFKVDGEYKDQEATREYWCEGIGTDEERVRMLTTTRDGDQSVVEWIVNKGSEEVYYRDEDNDWDWQSLPYFYGESMYGRMVEPVLVAEDAEFWRSHEKGEEYLTVEPESGGGEQDVRIYEVEVDEKIDDSVFEPSDG